MFEEFLLENRSKESNSILPDMIRVGSFNHHMAKIPVFLPLLGATGICFHTKDDLDPNAIRQMQYMALEILQGLESNMVHMIFVDVGLNTRYPILHATKLPNVTFVNSQERLERELDNIMERARYISTRCLGYLYSDLEQFNEHNSNEKEAYTILFISCFPRDFNNGMLSKVSLLIREGKKCGIRVIMNMPARNFGTTSYKSENEREVYDTINSSLLNVDCCNPQNALHLMNIDIYNKFANKYGFVFDEYTNEEISKVLASLTPIPSISTEVSDFLSIPIGKSGRETVRLEMGQKSGVYHGFIAGQSGSGKTNLLHNIISSIACSYSPDDIRLYLLDYKWGVEFQVYENHPNIEFLLLDNEDTSSGIALLESLKGEFSARSKAFFELGKTINNIDEYNRKSPKKMPRILVIIDEVQQLFSTFDLRRKVNPILKEIAKQGRAFGIHLLFSTQSYAQCEIDSDTLSQMPLRIAFSLSSGAECRAILGPDNEAPMSLPPFSAIYNNRNGDKNYNEIVKVDYFDKESIESILEKASRSHKGYSKFKQRIIKSSAIIERREQNITDISSRAIKRLEYASEDFETEFGF